MPVGYAQFLESYLKTPDQFPDPENGKPLCIAHAGRMEKANRIAEINDLMVNNFVMKGDKVKLLVCTVSESIQVFDQSVIDIRQASRDEFWELCKTQMHVIVKMSAEGGSSLALLEPMMMGVPAIVGPRKATEEALGKDYPFIVNSEVEAYALTKMFYEDYPAMYAKWADWHQGAFQQLLKRRLEEASIYTQLDEDIDAYGEVHDRFRAEKPAKADNAFVLEVLAQVGTADEFVLEEVVEQMAKAKKVDPTMLKKLRPADRDSRGLIWATAFNEFRKILQTFYGWEDASTKVGHMKRGKTIASD
jgi:hypothetical protein